MVDMEKIVKGINFNTADLRAWITNLVLAIVVLFICWLIAHLLRRSIRKTYENVEKFDQLLVPVITNISVFLVYAVGVVVILDIFGFNTNSMIALIGAAGIAVGLALKDTLQNIAAGVMLLILKPFKIDDFIECSSVSGTIKEVSVFTTIIETPDGLYVSAPNSVLWGNVIKNFTRNGKRRMDLIVGISYSDSIETGMKTLQELIKSDSRILSEPQPQVMVQALADSSVNLQMRVWTDVKDYWATFWDLNRQMKEKIEAAGLSIPFPQRDVHMVK